MTSKPDWDRWLVAPQGGALKKAGDPTRWGAQAFTLLQTPTAIDHITGTQVIQAATLDGYSRAWSLNGTLSLPNDLWSAAGNIEVTLQIQMGVGQAQVLHDVVVFSTVPANAGGPGYPLGSGLAETQYFLNGGPYLAYEVPSLSQVPGVRDRARSFALTNALVGKTINIRVVYTLQVGAPAVFPCQSQLNLVLAPYAAGEGI